MRKLFIALMMATALSATPVSAQIPVTDGGNLVAQAKSLMQQLKGYAADLQMIQNQLNQIMWLEHTAAGLIHNPSLGGVMALAGQMGLDTNLPISPFAMQNLVSGYGGMNSVGGLTGKLGALGSLVNTSYSNDSVWSCTADTFACRQQQAAAASHAGVKGIAGQIYQDMQNHMQVLQALRDRAAIATDTKDALDVASQIQVEHAWTQNASAQLQTVVLLAQAQEQTRSQRDAEKVDQDITNNLASRN